jgi:hypothetical protein
MNNNFHAPTAVSLRTDSASSDRAAGRRERLRTALQAISDTSTLRFQYVESGFMGRITYRVSGGALGAQHLRTLEKDFQGFEQTSRDNHTFVSVPLPGPGAADGRHAFWRHMYVAGMVLCLCGAVYFSDVWRRLEEEAKTE